jgi:DNA polymerase-3 subunit delta'
MPPQPLSSFATIQGHERARSFLRAAVAHHRLPHTLLFAGPDGTGKRATALALAAYLLCEHPHDDACGDCASCRQVAAGSHPDLHVVALATGKKEIGVDRARDVKRFTQLQAVRGQMKIAVVDDAHLLTVAAQNALLKTLEEPPKNSVLILVAHNPDALLATVRSRCQRVQFAPLPPDTVVGILTSDHGIEPATARMLATVAEGSPGRALALRRALGHAADTALLHLAGAGGARYVAVTDAARRLGTPENETAMKLELMLFQQRDATIRAVEAAHLETTATPGSPSVRAALRGAEHLHAAREVMRRGTPNRQLLLEALLLRLTDLR